MAAFYVIDVGLSEIFICGRAGEIIRAVCSAVFNKETSAFEAAFILIEEFVLGVKKFGALFVSGWHIRSGGKGGV